jgi:hypothetical protein
MGATRRVLAAIRQQLTALVAHVESGESVNGMAPEQRLVERSNPSSVPNPTFRAVGKDSFPG